jgi:hypothetical protein
MSTDGQFIGIDLAIRIRKRLPVAACERIDGDIKYVDLRNTFNASPSGIGNAGALDAHQRADFVQRAVNWLSDFEQWRGKAIARIAIDAPSSPCREGHDRRLAEVGLDGVGLSCFSTPTKGQFESIVAKAKEHLRIGGSLSRLPYANKIWMLVGFDLFTAIKAKWECIEVYPQAIVRSLGAGTIHKAKAAGFAAQCRAFAQVIGYTEAGLRTSISNASFGAAHDRLDAMMSAWVASLPEQDRIAYGDGFDDSIWVPRKATPSE